MPTTNWDRSVACPTCGVAAGEACRDLRTRDAEMLHSHPTRKPVPSRTGVTKASSAIGRSGDARRD